MEGMLTFQEEYRDQHVSHGFLNDFLHHLIICKKSNCKRSFCRPLLLKVRKIRFCKLSKDVPILSFWRVTQIVHCPTQSVNLSISSEMWVATQLFAKSVNPSIQLLFAEYMLGIVHRAIYILWLLKASPHIGLQAQKSVDCRVEFEALCFLFLLKQYCFG